jgi:hypothetical protein
MLGIKGVYYVEYKHYVDKQNVVQRQKQRDNPTVSATYVPELINLPSILLSSDCKGNLIFFVDSAVSADISG